eukprot:gene14037-7221_t
MEVTPLERHYVYRICSPTRSSWLTGRLAVHVNQRNPDDYGSDGGADLRMATLPQKLRGVGWETAAVGKWHVGARSPANLPKGRGFDRFFGFLAGGEDHFQQNKVSGAADASLVDLWDTEEPAWGMNGTYSASLYAGRAVGLVADFARRAAVDASLRFFLYLAWQNTHQPLQVPD